MKRNGLFVLVLALAAVLCTGCGVKDEDLKRLAGQCRWHSTGGQYTGRSCAAG